MNGLSDFHDFATKQKASIARMSFKEMSRSFNMAAQMMQSMDRIRSTKGGDSDVHDFELTAVALNAMAFYQAHLGLMLIGKHSHRFDSFGQKSISNPSNETQSTIHVVNGRWSKATSKTVSDIDQQKAAVLEAIEDLTRNDHSKLMETVTRAYDDLSKMYEDPAAEFAANFIYSISDHETVDDLCFLLKIAGVQLNDVFERKWPDSMPT